MPNRCMPYGVQKTMRILMVSLTMSLVSLIEVVAQSPSSDQSDLYQNKLRPQPPHRVLQAPQPIPKQSAAAPSKGIAPFISSQNPTLQDTAPPHRVITPYAATASKGEENLPEVPEYEAPLIFEESQDAAAVNNAPHASGPTTVSKPPDHVFPLAVTAEHVHSHFLHGDKTNAMPPIPAAVRQPVWKAPYSYGYFGAGRNRQWTLHYGYSQTYTQWTLR